MNKHLVFKRLVAALVAVATLIPAIAFAQASWPYPDTTPPWTSRWAVTDITPYSATINWTTDELSDSQVEFCTTWAHCGNFTPLVTDMVLDHVINLSGLTSYTRYYFYMYSRDQFGNLMTYGYKTFTTAWVAPETSPTPYPTPVPTFTPWPTPYPTQTPIPTPDVTPPWPSGWSVTNITPFAATINWTTNEPSDSLVEFCTTWSHCNNFTPLVPTLTTSHQINLSGLLPYTRYYFYMYSTDAYGNKMTYGYKTFTTAWTIPDTSPTPLPTPGPTFTPWPTPFPSQTPVPTPDVYPPWTSGWSVTNITPFAATINWSTNEPSDSQVEFCTTWAHCGNFTPIVSILTTSHVINLSGLTPYTRYYFYMYSADASGNKMTYGYKTFTTAWTAPEISPTPLPTPTPTPYPTGTPYPSQSPVPTADTTPPWVIRWTVYDITPTTAKVDWITDEASNGQIEYCLSWLNCGNFSPLTNDNSTYHSASLVNLVPGKRYYFWMYSRDLAGNLRIYGYKTFYSAWQ